MKKPFRPEKQILPPVYPGGKKALDEFIKSNLVYPEEALRNSVEGTVAIDYDVDVFGKVIAAKVRHGLGYGCDEEALRITRMLNYPRKKYQGMHVVFHMNIQIHFRMKPGTLPQPGLQINYTVVKKDSSPGPESGGYTINL